MEIKLKLEQRHIDGFCQAYRRQDDDPVSKEDFTLNCMIKYAEDVAGSQEIMAAEKEARTTAVDALRNKPTVIGEKLR